jgi:LmbE family N-acetylglucosaminyl deacetylase
MDSKKTASRPMVKRGSRLLLLLSGLLLLATSLFWAILSARLHNTNADQLIDGYLFESSSTFHQATFPGAHSFIIKWPLFAVAAALGNTSWAVTSLTVLCALLPVAALVFLLTRIERRPAVLSLWLVALSSMLLLVPAQPSPGTLLPVNFAMLTTRNLEYAVFLAVLVLLARTRSWRSWPAWVAGALAVLLLASDGLFMPLLFGGVGFIAVLCWKLSKQIIRWLGFVAAAYVAAYLVTKLLLVWDITGLSNQGSVSPYHLGGGLSALAQAVVYGVLGIGTLFGANPAYAHLSIGGWPAAFQAGMNQPGAVAYAANGLILVALLALTVRFVRRYRQNRDWASTVAGMTLGAALTAAVIYVLTDHYYPVDSRYLSIWFFAVVLCAAVSLRSMRLSKKVLVPVGLLLLIALPFAVRGSWAQYTALHSGLQPAQMLQRQVAVEVARYHVTTLVGDYWDVTPIRQLANNQPTIVPMSSCTQPQAFLSSRAWQKAGPHDSMAYFVNGNPLPTGFKRCDPQVIRQHFGVPTKEIPIMVPGLPQSWLLIYDDSLQRPVASQAGLQPPTDCPAGRVMNIVAHEDDDLLFMNPDLQTAIDQQKCLTTVFVTAGDSGASDSYSHERMRGSQAAYSYMYNLPDVWQTRQARLQDKSVTVATLNGAPRLSLIFLNLPDGSPTGNGFKSREHASLARLRYGMMTHLRPIEGQGSYDRDGMEQTLLTLMNRYQPQEVRTQNYSNNWHDGDHSDHHAVGYFTRHVFEQYNANATLVSYAGYPVRNYPANVAGSVLAGKEGAFFAYAGYDGAACTTAVICNSATAYGQYLPRQYSRVVANQQYQAPTVPTPLPRPVAVAEQRAAPGRRQCLFGSRHQIIDCALRPGQLAY